jgi:hypothetical protein
MKVVDKHEDKLDQQIRDANEHKQPTEHLFAQLRPIEKQLVNMEAERAKLLKQIFELE